jgi:hypothetical protein|tara:strand:- start:390 stop:1427 length:1038 start_codon:yes stop_codon:yes gene_type:complete
MAYVGKQPLIGNFIKLDAITTSATATYNLTNGSVAVSPQSANNCIVSLNGVIQAPTDAYTISGSQIIFDSALTSSDAIDFILVLGDVLDVGTVSDDTITTAKIQNLAVTDAKLAGSITNAKLAGSIANSKLANSSITINGSGVALGGSVTIGETKPTISSLTPSVITNSATAVVIAGTNFISVPQVEAINSSGAIVAADSVSFTSATSITATFTLPVDGTYFIRVENNDGNAVRTSTASLTVSDDPVWVTASGSLGTFAGSTAVGTINLVCTDAVSFAVTTGAVTAGLTFTTGVGTATITGTQTAHTSAATDSFSVTATDAQGQTAVRAFTISYSFTIAGSGGFN